MVVPATFVIADEATEHALGRGVAVESFQVGEVGAVQHHETLEPGLDADVLRLAERPHRRAEVAGPAARVAEVVEDRGEVEPRAERPREIDRERRRLDRCSELAGVEVNEDTDFLALESDIEIVGIDELPGLIEGLERTLLIALGSAGVGEWRSRVRGSCRSGPRALGAGRGADGAHEVASTARRSRPRREARAGGGRHDRRRAGALRLGASCASSKRLIAPECTGDVDPGVDPIVERARRVEPAGARGPAHIGEVRRDPNPRRGVADRVEPAGDLLAGSTIDGGREVSSARTNQRIASSSWFTRRRSRAAFAYAPAARSRSPAS